MKNFITHIVLFCCIILVQPMFAQTEYAVYEDAPLYLDVPGGANQEDNYTWYFNGEGPIATGPTYFIDNVTAGDIGTYSVVIDNGNPPDETLFIEVVLQELALDSIGGEYNAAEFIVKFVEGTSQVTIDSLRDVYEAELLDTCLCDIELWYIADLVVDPENKKEEMESEPEIETVDFNYVVEAHSQGNQVGKGRTSSENMEKENGGGSVLVAIIDTGVDQSHSNLQNIFWINQEESEGNEDNDGNCLFGDIMGYDFIDDDTEPADTRWKHATHLAGLVDSISLKQAEIMNLKIFSIQTKSTLFPGICAAYYAGTKEAQVINMSWGWQGLPAKALKNAIAFAGDECGALVICSAGNDGMNNDSIPHYPSSYELENIIEVAALDLTEGGVPSRAAYSNYGNSIDVAVPGFWWSTVPGNVTDTLQGTSMSAAALSGMAARMFAANPEIGWKEVKDCLLSSSQFRPDLKADSLNGQWFSTDVMEEAAMNCIEQAAAAPECPDVFPVSISIFETQKVEPMSISPIPFTNRVDFEFEMENSGDVTFEIYDISGRKVHAEKIWLASGEQRIKWDGSHLPKGMYVCYIHNTKQHFSGKMIK